MKIRVFENMDDAVFRIVVNTEDFSQDDMRLMCQYGEPEIDCGGTVSYTYDDTQKTKEFGHQMIRVLHGFPFALGFDSRDYDGGCGEAIAVGEAWKTALKQQIADEMSALRLKARSLPTEEVFDNI